MLLGGVLLLLGEANTEDSEQIAVSGLHINVSFDQGLPLFDHRTEFVSGQVHSVELSKAVLALNVLARQLEFLVRTLSVLKSKKL